MDLQLKCKFRVCIINYYSDATIIIIMILYPTVAANGEITVQSTEISVTNSRSMEAVFLLEPVCVINFYACLS